MLPMRNPAEIVSGLFLIGTALLFLWIGRALPAGSVTQMGPGYTPNLLAVIQLVLGLAVLAIGVVRDGEPLEPWRWRPVVTILAAVAFFAVSLEYIGLVGAVVGTVILSGFATPQSRHVQNVLLAGALALFTVLVFVKGLSLQIPVWPLGWGRE
ncbi:tripartite tricarboxylate transporter TctB family protein [Bosea caraganae]|uniref:Tripartite tricarboxylate transporter TctB family protein n=1 Tax=Bosea caraganae TaxID=2763117 RepID=A0A370L0M7_9HYPH|nr:tripartite tricarboxylate transporter TctB family protein [Bosea caraganae]RDJ20656.1 tripartite tricarboxylate transporter TctB family protein [Bosea caraganae]RDJ28933.1 tripartite tricarboxylate transporter TctB family protein [Bosea caraganae]